MPNENMVTISAIARKGGSGKSMLVKALGSAAIAGGNSVLMIDADPQGDLTEWFARAQEGGMVPTKASFARVSDTPQLQEVLNAAYEAGDTDYVFIDTAGQGGEWAEKIAMLSDFIVTPVVATESDFKVGIQTVEWYRNLHDRVPNPQDLPPHRVVVTNFPAKASKREVRLLKDGSRLFPIINNVVQRRNAYQEMDARGFLTAIKQGYQTDPNQLQRIHARLYDEALVEAMDVLNDIVGV